ncbi:hypothetical protein PQX77_022220 [Marasmius sp. AFHP31]|nr:hypothetical protein PQX77_022220 [Marasmius sp. AFHP31]
MSASTTPDSEISETEVLQTRSPDHLVEATVIARQNLRSLPELSTASIARLIEGVKNEAKQDRKAIEILEQQVAVYKSFLHPIQRLPPEILSRIIAYAGDTNVFSGEATIHWQSAILSCVSPLWRELALKMPEMWCHLRVELPVRRNHYAAVSKAMKTHIERSGHQRNLYVELFIVENASNDTFLDVNHDVLSDIFAHSHRISDLDIQLGHRVPPNTPIGAVLKHFHKSLPVSSSTGRVISRLTSLRLERESQAGRPSPEYHALGLDLHYLLQPNSLQPMITTITLNPVNVPHLTSVLQLLPNLTNVEVGLSPTTQAATSTNPPTLVLSHLQHLIIRNSSLKHSRDFFSFITDIVSALDAPRLKSLTIARGTFAKSSFERLPPSDHGPRLVNSLKAFISRSNAPLESFSCLGLTIYASDLKRLVEAMPDSLTELNLEDNPTYGALHRSALELLALSEGTNVLPRIRILKLFLLYDREWGTVMDVIRSRATSGLKWCRVRIPGSEEKRKEASKIMKDNPGLDIDVDEPSYPSAFQGDVNLLLSVRGPIFFEPRLPTSDRK